MVPARVVEVQKRYAFISPETDGDINTKDVWLATVARKHLQLHRDERNTIVVGDKVLVQPIKIRMKTTLKRFLVV